MNFTSYRFYLCTSNCVGDYECARIKTNQYVRTPFSRIVTIPKTWPSFLDRCFLYYQLYPMDVIIVPPILNHHPEDD